MHIALVCAKVGRSPWPTAASRTKPPRRYRWTAWRASTVACLSTSWWRWSRCRSAGCASTPPPASLASLSTAWSRDSTSCCRCSPSTPRAGRSPPSSRDFPSRALQSSQVRAMSFYLFFPPDNFYTSFILSNHLFFTHLRGTKIWVCGLLVRFCGFVGLDCSTKTILLLLLSVQHIYWVLKM